MKAFLHKYAASLFSVLTVVVVIQLIAAALLYVKNTAVQNQNRVLILQNDSILSENIRLRNTLEQQGSLQHQNSRLTSIK